MMSDDSGSIAKKLAEQLSAARAQPVSRPTWLETEMAKTRAELQKVCKYPLREWVVLTPAQLARARNGLGVGQPCPSKQEGDRRPLTSEELHKARVAAGMPVSTGWERDC